ncbi:MAG: carboxymuconolactone decarboxylase family protein [Gammaproteobacteria bacterium]
MSNIQALPIGNAGQATEVLDSIKQKIGMVPNIYATIAHSPAALKVFLGFGEALAGGVLSASLREQIALTVAGENGCDYCASAHTAVAKGTGLSAEEAARNLVGTASDPRIAAILNFSKAVVSKRGWLDDGELEQLRSAGITDQEIVEIIATVAVNLFTNYFNHIAGTDIDFPVVNTDRDRHAA